MPLDTLAEQFWMEGSMSGLWLRSTAFSLAVFFADGAPAALIPGHILVADQTRAAVIDVDPTTGAQTLLSSGGFFRNPAGIVIEPSGNVIVSDRSGHRLIRVDPN